MEEEEEDESPLLFPPFPPPPPSPSPPPPPLLRTLLSSVFPLRGEGRGEEAPEAGGEGRKGISASFIRGSCVGLETQVASSSSSPEINVGAREGNWRRPLNFPRRISVTAFRGRGWSKWVASFDVPSS